MKRRDFITLLGGAAAAWPLAANAQQAKATIGLLGTGSAAAQSHWTAAFVQRMRELGWVEARNLAIEYRWAEGHTERLRDLANELARLKVDVIVSHNTPGPLARQRHRAVESDARCCRKAPRAPAPDRPWFAPIGGPSRHR